MSRDITPFGLRMPPELKQSLEKLAKRKGKGHSLNAEIVGRLNDSLEFAERPLHSYSDGDLIRELMERYERGEVFIRIGRNGPTEEFES